jgi:hypothetical protein
LKDRKESWQTTLCWTAAALIFVFVAVPSARAVYMNVLRLVPEWDWRLLTSPATYLFFYASLMAAFVPLGAVLKCTPLLRAEEATPPVLAVLNLMHLGFALTSALVWHFLAWASYPVLKDGQMRFVPFWPVPDWGFLQDFLYL